MSNPSLAGIVKKIMSCLKIGNPTIPKNMESKPILDVPFIRSLSDIRIGPLTTLPQLINSKYE